MQHGVPRDVGREHLTRLLFALVLATVVAQHWFASTPLPWGGPNVVLGALAALAATFLVGLRLRHGGVQCGGAFTALRPAAGVVAVALLWLLWALVVHGRTGTAPPVRLAQTALGIGVLCATCLAVTTLRRARLMALTFVAATFVSAIFGLAVAFVQEPFLTVWLRIADVQPKFLEAFWRSLRLAGMAADPPTFGYQLAVALPLALAALLFAARRRRLLPNGGAVLWYVMLMTLATALVIDGARSPLFAGLVGGGFVVTLALCAEEARRRLPWVAGLMALWFVVAFPPAFRSAPVAGELPAVTRVDDVGVPGIEGFAVGMYVPSSSEEQRAFGEIIGLTPGSDYVVQARARQLQAAGRPSETVGTARSDGKLTASWRVSHATGVVRYESRVRRVGATAWTTWRRLNLYGGQGLTTAGIATEMRHMGPRHKWAPKLSRMLDWSSYSANSRLLMLRLAGRSAVSNPLGSGRYAPSGEALSDLLPGHPQALELLHGDPHNQFLLALVDYGLPGLGLLVIFYLLVFRSLSRSVLRAFRARDAGSLYLVAAVGGAMLAYIVNSLAHGQGPFTGDWGHFVLVGLAFAIERITTFPSARQPASPACVRSAP